MLAALLLEVLGARAGETLTVTIADELSAAAALEGGLDSMFGRAVTALSVWDLGNGVSDCSGDSAGDEAEGVLALSCTGLWTLAALVACASSGVCGAVDGGAAAAMGSTSTEEDGEDVWSGLEAVIFAGAAVASAAVDEVGSVTWTVVVSNSAKDVSLTGNLRDWFDAKLTSSQINGGD
jgi:hypothetical protein